MKRRTKLGLSLAALGFGAIALSSCTASFCSVVDLSRMKYAFDPGISCLQEGSETLEFSLEGGKKYTITNVKIATATWVVSGDDAHVGSYLYADDVVFDQDNKNEKKLTYLNNVIKASRDAGYITIDGNAYDYLTRVDYLVFNTIFAKAADTKDQDLEYSFTDPAEKAAINRDLSYYSYLKYTDGKKSLVKFEEFDAEARKEVTSSSPLYKYVASDKRGELSPDCCPSSDYIKTYHAKINGWVSQYRTCLTTRTDKYGSYGYSTKGIYIGAKTWGDAWSKGFFEGLLVYPIGWLIDQITFGFRGVGASGGVAAFLGIVFVTFIIRSVMLLATFRQTQSNAKMTELQPEIQKIQNKYPNANTSRAEKARMGQEMQALYKKNKVNPFMTLIVMIIQFPVFICVWGALSGSAVLTDGTFLGLRLSVTIKDALFTSSGWSWVGGYSAVTALFLFLLMAAAQTVSMLLPQWIQKKKAKEVAKLGKNPAQKQQSNRMKWFTYIMLALIIFMGFSLVSAMGIYWFIGAIFSIVQTLVIQVINNRKAKRK